MVYCRAGSSWSLDAIYRDRIADPFRARGGVHAVSLANPGLEHFDRLGGAEAMGRLDRLYPAGRTAFRLSGRVDRQVEDWAEPVSVPAPGRADQGVRRLRLHRRQRRVRCGLRLVHGGGADHRRCGVAGNAASWVWQAPVQRGSGSGWYAVGAHSAQPDPALLRDCDGSEHRGSVHRRGHSGRLAGFEFCRRRADLGNAQAAGHSGA